MEQQKLIDWLKDDFETFKKEMKESNQEINAKVDEVLRFKWQIIGGSLIVSVVFTIIVQFASFVLK